jgi:recombinational DNA repair protein RecR
MKSLPPGELVSVMEHVAHCDECRALLLEAGSLTRVSTALSPEHLTFAELEALAKVPVSQEPAEAMEHLAFCAICSDELRDLRSALSLSQSRAGLRGGGDRGRGGPVAVPP